MGRSNESVMIGEATRHWTDTRSGDLWLVDLTWPMQLGYHPGWDRNEYWVGPRVTIHFRRGREDLTLGYDGRTSLDDLGDEELQAFLDQASQTTR